MVQCPREDAPVGAPSLGHQLLPHYTISAGGTSAFYASPLDDLLCGLRRTDLFITGWGLEGPVHSTMRAANDRGYECLLIEDASIPHDASLVESAISMIEFSGGIFGAHAKVNDVLSALPFLDHTVTTNESWLP